MSGALGLAQISLDRYGIITPEIIARFESRWTWAGEAAASEAVAEAAATSVRASWEGHKRSGEVSVLGAPREAPWSWGELSEPLRRMEMRGEVRRGYFVNGLSGVQYALPQAVEALRAARDGLARSDEVVVLSALDPVNLYGGELRTLPQRAQRARKLPPRAKSRTSPQLRSFDLRG